MLSLQSHVGPPKEQSRLTARCRLLRLTTTLSERQFKVHDLIMDALTISATWSSTVGIPRPMTVDGRSISPSSYPRPFVGGRCLRFGRCSDEVTQQHEQIFGLRNVNDIKDNNIKEKQKTRNLMNNIMKNSVNQKWQLKPPSFSSINPLVITCRFTRSIR